MTDHPDRLRAALADRYVLEHELGAGGMATVYHATDVRHKRNVAVKVLKPELSAILGAERFLQEIETAAALNHPHILPLYDSGEAGGFLFYVMPVVGGESLRDRMERDRQLPVLEAVTIAKEVAAALDYAHRHGVVHRDIKPENILLHEGVAMVTDFGIALAVGEAGGPRLTETGLSLGTPHYMSPEQAAGDPQVDGRSDVYAMGCVLFEMLAGQTPFTGPTAQSVIAQRLSESPPSVRTFRDGLPDALVQAVAKSLARAPVDRHPSARAMADALEPTAPAPTVVSSHPIAGFQTNRVAAAVGIGAVLVGAAWFGANRVRSNDAAILESSFAVFPFSVNGPEEFGYLREGLVTLLSRNLTGFDQMKPVDPSAALKAAGEGDVDSRQGAQIARRMGAGRFVLGSVNSGGDEVRIHASLYSLKDSIDALSSAEVTGNPADILALVDELTAQLLAGQETGAASDRMIRSAALMTSSLPALRAYLEGEQHFRKDQQEEAQDAFRRALDEDTLFTVARYRLAVSQQFNHDHDPALQEVTRALQQADRLSEHDRRVLEAFDVFLTGDVDEAERRFRALITEFPRDLEAKVLLAELLLEYSTVRAESRDRAKRLYEEVLEADPGFACVYCALMNIAQAEQDGEAYRDLHLKREEAHGHDSVPTISTRIEFRVRTFVEEDAQAMAEMFADVRADIDSNENRAHIYLHDVSGNWAYVGEFDSARALVQQGYDLEPNERDRSEVLGRVSLAGGQWQEAGRQWTTHFASRPNMQTHARAVQLVVRPPLAARLDGLEDVRARLLTWTEGRAASRAGDESWPERLRPISRLYLLGLVDSRLGERQRALAWVDSLGVLSELNAPERRLATDIGNTIRADVTLRQGNAREVLNILQRMRPNVPPAWLYDANVPYYHAQALRAEAHLQLGEFEPALRILQHSVRGLRRNTEIYGTWHRDMALALDGLGRYPEARTHYAAFIDAWSEADPELQPIVGDARARLEALVERTDASR